MAEPRIFTVPNGAPFLAVLADAMVSGRFGPLHDPADPMRLARVTLYLPTRRAARAFSACLAERIGAGPLLLPRIVALGDVDEAETAQIGAGGYALGRVGPVDDLTRRMLLTTLVDAWGRSANRSHLKLDAAEPSLVPATLSEAWGLAGDLAALIDQMQTEGVAIERLAKLDAVRFDRIWELNASFLAILAEAWPAILAERDLCDPAAFRNRMLAAERERLLSGAASGPIIAAGSTGSIPATADLLGAIARLPNGAVVLPGLDLDLGEAAWRAIGKEPAPSHPQAALHHLLDRLKLPREAVTPLGEASPARAARSDLLREAMLPATVTDLWSGLGDRVSDAAIALAFDGVSVIEAADEREEALAVALALRESLETPGLQAALITPDRGLAERVAVELKRWNVAVDDSAGLPLARWPAGALLRLVLRAARTRLATADLVALLAHPQCRLGLPFASLRRGATALEIGLWRGIAVGDGVTGLRENLAHWDEIQKASHVPRPRRRLGPDDRAAANAVLEALERALAPLTQALSANQPALADVVASARAAMAAVSLTEEGVSRAFTGPDGESLAALFDDLDAAREVMPQGGSARDLVAILEGLMAERVVRRPASGHPRVKIWGLLEARLLEADHIVLGGLNESVWPPQTQTDAFLNRPMRAELGLSAPERRIGQTAHDFTHAFASAKVTLSRARKSGEAETIASRFWQRLKAVSGQSWTKALLRGQTAIALAGELSRAAPAKPIERPAPRPARELQPLSLSVTEVETLYRDPYQIHARKILKLDALDPLVDDPNAQDRGKLLHDIVETFAKTYPEQLPADALAILVAIGRERFKKFGDTPEVAAFWWPRFIDTATHFIAWETRRRGEIARIGVEHVTARDFKLPDGATFRLNGRADRIELTHAPSLRIIDFKTGAPPSKKQVEKGFAPQLTLEADLAVRAGFSGFVGPTPVDAVLYLKLTHDPKAWSKGKPLDFGEETLADVAARHLQHLLEHIAALRSGREAYLSRRAPDYIKFESPYDHLARVKEWAAAAGDDEGGEA